MKCALCGNEVEENAVFCGNCGTPVENGAAAGELHAEAPGEPQSTAQPEPEAEPQPVSQPDPYAPTEQLHADQQTPGYAPPPAPPQPDPYAPGGPQYNPAPGYQPQQAPPQQNQYAPPPPPPNTIPCPICGTPNDPRNTQCAQCGNMFAPRPQPQPQPQPMYGYEQKSKMAAGLLGIFLGGLGIHNFYLGFTNRGLLQLLVYLGGWLLCWLFIPILAIFAMSIWGLVEGILILTGNENYRVDAKGVPLKD